MFMNLLMKCLVQLNSKWLTNLNYLSQTNQNGSIIYFSQTQNKQIDSHNYMQNFKAVEL